MNVYPAVEADGYRLDRTALWAGTIATALVAGLLAMLEDMAAQGLLKVDLIAPRGGPAFATTTAYQLTLSAIVATALASVLVQVLMYVSPRPLLFFGLIGSTATGVVSLWPFTTAAVAASQFATAAAHLSLGMAIWVLTATIARHARSVP